MRVALLILAGGHVAAPGPCPYATLFDADLELVDLAIAHARCETEHILTVEFLGDSGERGTEVIGIIELEVAPAGFFGESLKTAIRTTPNLTYAVEVIDLQPDGVNHDFFGARQIEYLAPPNLVLGVFTIGKDQDNLPSLDATECVDARRDGVVESGRIPELEAVEIVDQGIPVTGEVCCGQYLNLVVKSPDLATIIGEHANDELLGARHEEIETGRHAGAGVEHDDHGDRTDFVLEEYDVLDLIFVQNLKILFD